MDIRRFFSPNNASKKVSGNFTNITNKQEIHSRDKGNTTSRKRKLVIIDSDSEEEPIPVRKSCSAKQTDRKITPSKDVRANRNNDFGESQITKLNFEGLKKFKAEAKALKQVSSNDFFKDSSGKVLNTGDELNKGKELKIEDDEFDKTLKQLDVGAHSHQANSCRIETYCASPRKKTKHGDKTLCVEYNSNVTGKNDSSSNVSVKLEAAVKPNGKTAISENITDSKGNISSEMRDASELTRKPDHTPESKKRNSANYVSFLHRDGPQALGSKEIPEGQEGCLQGFTFIVTGVLESFEREEVHNLISEYGGKVMKSVSKNTHYMIVGRDAGPSKLEKAEKLEIKLINENEFLDLIRTRPGRNVSPKNGKPMSSESKSIPNKNLASSEPKAKPEAKKALLCNETIHNEANSVVSSETQGGKSMLMWVDKYRPSSLKQVIGQQGDRSCAHKLSYWLCKWWENNIVDKKVVQKKWNAKDDGSIFKAALLSGPPGIGKTTTAQLACKEAGLEHVELNASDTRSKKCLQSVVSELLQNNAISASSPGNQLVKKHAVIFDEVDGMSGNEDRGGTQELIALIKQSKIPVICICNDRQHPKIRSLANYCFDLRFIRPRVEQIKAAMMSLLHKEKMKVPPETLQEIITATNQDMRQVLHHLCFLNSKDLSSTKTLKTAGKDVRLSPFDVLKKVFSTEEAKTTINEKASLFFHDYSLAPLFVQENYLSVKPVAAKANIHKHLDLLCQTADSISYGDTIDRTIRSQNNWGLLPVQAIFASVIPGELMRGYYSQMITFPSWLGKNSSRNHMDHVLQEVHMHTRLQVSGDKSELALEYLPLLSYNLTSPLIQKSSNGVEQVLNVMENYFLLREDLNSIVELSLWPGQGDPMASIEPKAKAALTRALNKESFKNPYAVVAVKKGKKRPVHNSFDSTIGEDDIEGNESDSSNDDINLDAMIKQKKKTTVVNEEGLSTKGKGRGKGLSSRGRGQGKK